MPPRRTTLALCLSLFVRDVKEGRGGSTASLPRTEPGEAGPGRVRCLTLRKLAGFLLLGHMIQGLGDSWWGQAGVNWSLQVLRGLWNGRAGKRSVRRALCRE